MSSATTDALRGFVSKFKPATEPEVGAAVPPGPAQQQGSQWAQAMNGGTKRKLDRRPFIILFLIFFGAFTWLYILYNVSHSKKESADAPAAAEQASGSVAAPPALAPAPAASTAYGAYPPVAAPPGSYAGPATGAYAGAPPPMATAAPAYPGSYAASYPGSGSQLGVSGQVVGATPYGAAPAVPASIGYPAAAAPPAAYGAPVMPASQAGAMPGSNPSEFSGMPVDPQLQASYSRAVAMNPHEAISAPRGYRHAIGPAVQPPQAMMIGAQPPVPIGAGAPLQRQRVFVSR